MEVKSQRADYVEHTRRALLDSAERLFIADGYRATSQDAIAAGARFTKGALYRHFADKEAVFVAVLERVQHDAVGQLVSESPDPTWEGAMAAVAAYLDLAMSERFRRIVLEEAPGVLGWTRWRALDEQFTGAVLRRLIVDLHERQVISAPDPAVMARLVCAMVAEAALGLAGEGDTPRGRAEGLQVLEQLMAGTRPRSDA